MCYYQLAFPTRVAYVKFLIRVRGNTQARFLGAWGCKSPRLPDVYEKYMPSNIQRLRIAIEEWLIRNDLDMDTGFYSIEEWRERNEDYLNDAELVLVYEGGLYTMLNYGCDTQEFDDYIESFGYYYEGLGHKTGQIRLSR